MCEKVGRGEGMERGGGWGRDRGTGERRAECLGRIV